MSMLNVRLTDEDERKLGQVLAATKSANKSDLIKRLINDQWVSLQAGKTFLERRGGHPTYLLSGSSDSSDRKSRKKSLADHYEKRAKRRQGKAK